MYLLYYDESGDDGWPGSAHLFVLSGLYLHEHKWRDVFAKLLNLRRQLKADFGLPVRVEMHAKPFLLNKSPYCDFQFDDQTRVRVVDRFCDVLANLPGVQIVNVVINKVNVRDQNYDVLDRALTYSVQRVENDLRKNHPNDRFLIITDPGRIGAMRKTVRRIQRINPIPSMFSGASYRQEIALVVEDPLQKDSKESYFIQLCDLVAYIVSLHVRAVLGVAGYPRRLPALVNEAKVRGWMTAIRPALNRKAARGDEFGLVIYPK